MFGAQKTALAQAQLEHRLAVANKRLTAENFRQQRHAFIARPVNLFFPFAAGILIAASQFKNVPKGLNRLPFMNIAKSALGAYGLVAQLQAIRQQGKQSKQ